MTELFMTLPTVRSRIIFKFLIGRWLTVGARLSFEKLCHASQTFEKQIEVFDRVCQPIAQENLIVERKGRIYTSPKIVYGKLNLSSKRNAVGIYLGNVDLGKSVTNRCDRSYLTIKFCGGGSRVGFFNSQVIGHVHQLIFKPILHILDRLRVNFYPRSRCVDADLTGRVFDLKIFEQTLFRFNLRVCAGFRGGGLLNAVTYAHQFLFYMFDIWPECTHRQSGANALPQSLLPHGKCCSPYCGAGSRKRANCCGPIGGCTVGDEIAKCRRENSNNTDSDCNCTHHQYPFLPSEPSLSRFTHVGNKRLFEVAESYPKCSVPSA